MRSLHVSYKDIPRHPLPKEAQDKLRALRANQSARHIKLGRSIK